MKKEVQDNHCEHFSLKIERLGNCGNLYISDQERMTLGDLLIWSPPLESDLAPWLALIE